VWWILITFFLLDIVHHGHGQDDDQNNDPGDEPPADGKEEEEGEEEAWKYVEFLKDEISANVENILQETLVEAKDRTGLTVIDETVAKTMEQVMEIREKLLLRIKDLRKGEIKTDPTQNIKQEEMLSEFRMEIMTILLKLVDKDAATIQKLKEISQDLLRFKMTISNEIMRMLMLPQSTGPITKVPLDADCAECATLKDISYKVENLIACAEKEEDAEETDEADAGNDDYQDTGDAEADVVEAKPGEKCVPPDMYAMELIQINELIDGEIKNHYNTIIVTVDEEKRSKLFQNLDNYKALRDSVDEVITKLMDQNDADGQKLKKTITRSLSRTNTDLKSQLKNCQNEFCPNSCDSCAAEVLFDAVDKMNDFKNFFNSTDDEESKRDFVRSELIKYINDIGNDAREILIKKAKEGKLDECEEEKSGIYKTIKPPMWMLVNTTIFAEISQVELMVDAMIAQLEEMRTQYCGVEPKYIDPTPVDGPNCEWEEYENTKKYLTLVDQIIQDALFKAKDDNAQMTALLGFVDIQALFDKRVKTLFEANLECPDEVNQIKQTYMSQLNKCMAEFMNTKLSFKDMSRLQRITCTKVLRGAMETRMGILLQSELQKSLDDIAGSGSVTADDYDTEY